jgi:hypothetical protein
VELAPTGQWYTFGPLMVILALTGVKEFIEDYVRALFRFLFLLLFISEVSKPEKQLLPSETPQTR